MTPAKTSAASGARVWGERLFALAAGLFAGLCLLKLGSPCILDSLVAPPTTAEEWRVSIWPPRYGYPPLILLVVSSLFVARLRPKPGLLAVVPPLVWFGWQCLSATQTSSPKLTALTLPHFAGCLGCYFVGLFALGRVRDWRWFSAPLLIALLLMLRAGIQQHFGGLAETKAFINAYYASEALPAELVKRMNTGRIFATMFYPNAFAGALLLLLPFSVASVWEMTGRLRTLSRGIIAGIIAVAGLACLVWSGSKAGWLIFLALGILTGWRLPFPASVKLCVAGVVLGSGLVAFGIRYASFFQKGATSVVARFDYWRAATKIFAAHPMFGAGPGAFQPNYARIKSPDAEMARLVHNDYLEQASDSGLLGCLTYLAWIGGILAVAVRRSLDGEWTKAALGLGIIGWFAQGLVEFGLYVTGLAWPAFLLGGALVGSSLNRVDKGVRNR